MLLDLTFYAGHKIQLSLFNIILAYSDLEVPLTHIELIDKSVIGVRETLEEIWQQSQDSLCLVTLPDNSKVLMTQRTILYTYTSLDTGELTIKTVKGDLIPIKKISLNTRVAE